MLESKKHTPKQAKVLVTGVFDLLHQEHIAFLKKAKSLGDWLMVGVESDARVRRLKGKGRPIQSQEERLSNLKQLGFIDQVFILPEKFDHPDDHLNLLKKLQPQFLAVSSHTAHRLEKERLMRQIGGKLVVVHKHNPAISTSKIIKTRNLKH